VDDHAAFDGPRPAAASGRRTAGLPVAVAVAAAATAFALWQPSLQRTLGFVLLGRWALAGAIYLAAAWGALRIAAPVWRMRAFAAVNVLALPMFYDPATSLRWPAALILATLSVLAAHYGLLRWVGRRRTWHAWLAFGSPVAVLALVRYLPYAMRFAGQDPDAVPLGTLFVGLSYMAFRLSYLVLEVRNGTVPMPTPSEYVAFAMFLPTFMIGPISRYHSHWQSLSAAAPPPWTMPAQRILVGAVKYFVLGNVINQTAFRGLLLDGHPHPPIDLVVAAVSYHLYLYCNFSGICDVAIGGAALLGIRVDENFRHPLVARNPQEYWTRWHITLSTYMRDVVFSPLTKALVMRGVRAEHAVAAAVVAVFVLLGIWHGAGAHYALYGALQALGVVTTHYFTLWLKRRGREAWRQWHESRVIEAIAVAGTFLYTSATLFVFANDFATMRQIFDVIAR